MIINAWQQIEDEGKNIMGFEMSERARYRTIIDTRIKWSKKNENSTIIYNSPARKMMRLFNAIPGEIRNKTGIETDQFKKDLDRWLNGVSDEPEIDGYRAKTISNSIVHQASQANRERVINIRGDPPKGSLAHQSY